jgi:dCTP diphosphatase
MRSDSQTTIQTLKQLLEEFRDQRDWQQFHDLKNLAEAISIEAAELLELFLWKMSPDVMKALKSDSEFKKSVEAELADVICFSLNFANAAEIDISTIVTDKINQNRMKYPVAKAKGIATKYDKL